MKDAYTSLMENIGKRMKRFRMERDLSVNEAAQKAGIPASTYREWEAGRQIKGEPYEKIASALNVSLYELLTGTKPNQREVFVKLNNIEVAYRELKTALESVIVS